MRPAPDLAQRSSAAAAFRSDRRGNAPAVRRRAARLLKASARAEARYVRDCLHIMRGVQHGVRSTLDIHAPEPEVRHDAGDVALRRVTTGYAGLRPVTSGYVGLRHDAARSWPPPDLHSRLFLFVRQHTGAAFDRMAKVVSVDSAESLALFGITPAMVPGLGGMLASAREDNIRLLQKAAGTYVSQVEEVLRDPENAGLRVEELAALLQERGEVSESRAMLIAKDQTLKVNAQVGQARMQAAGVSRYDWSTAHDERVRRTHAELDGQRFTFDAPPITNDDGDRNAPGGDYQCRCVALPVIDALEPPDEPSGTRLRESDVDE